MWGAFSNERTGHRLPESQSAVISLLSVCTIYILHVIKCMYIKYIQGLCQSSLQLICTDRAENTISNSTSIAAALSVAAGTCLPSRRERFRSHILKDHSFYNFIALILPTSDVYNRRYIDIIFDMTSDLSSSN
jgi:hypothetical protein